MNEIRNGLLYSSSHEWVQKQGDDTVVVGITDHAQHEVGEVVFVEVPEEGKELNAGDELGALESVKTVEMITSPVSGKVIRSNAELGDFPDIVNSSPYDDGWIAVIRLKDVSELGKLMDAEAYGKFIG
ncbi:MAG: glycine cleavage system protein GcvH [Methanomassiliicoccaceae archaeon]|nr:glycine cleavage system protein GcvH [Methanomassiliicoccaceae archaeon]